MHTKTHTRLKAALFLSTALAIAHPAAAQVPTPTAPVAEDTSAAAVIKRKGNFLLLLGGLGLVAAIDLAMHSDDEETGTGGDDGSTPPPNFEPTPFDQENVDAAIANNTQAAPELIAAVEASEEYDRNAAFKSANLSNKIALGFTGEGVSVGVMDAGIKREHVGMNGITFGEGYAAQDPATRPAQYPGANHGTTVGQILAGQTDDGNFARGVAPGVTLHDIGFLSVSPQGGLSTSSADTAAAFRHIADTNIDIVNMSVARGVDAARTDMRGTTERAFSRDVLESLGDATRSGTIFVVAAGNDDNAATNNVYAGLGLLDAYANNQFINVVGLDETGEQLADFSSTCGQTQSYCLSAVAERLVILNDNGREATNKGTSFGTPIVAGSLALLKEQFPELSSRELVQLVLLTADDLGAQGVDAVYGHGRLNMNTASNPVGDLRIVSADQVDSPFISVQDAHVYVPHMAQGLSTVLQDVTLAGLDDFNRAFALDDDALFSADTRSQDPILPALLHYTAPGGEAVVIAGEHGAWVRHGSGIGAGYVNPELLIASSPTATLGYSPLGLTGVGPVLTYEGDRAFFGAAKGEDGAHSLWAGTDIHNVRYLAGVILEDEGVMGIRGALGSGRTVFVSAHASHDLNDRITAHLGATYAHGSAGGGAGVIRDLDVDAASAHASLSVREVAGGELTLSVGTPLTAFSGDVLIDAPIGRDPSTGDPTFGVIRSSEAQGFSSDFPLDLGVAYSRQVSRNMTAGVSAVQRFVPDGDDDTFVGVSLSAKF